MQALIEEFTIPEEVRDELSPGRLRPITEPYMINGNPADYAIQEIDKALCDARLMVMEICCIAPITMAICVPCTAGAIIGCILSCCQINPWSLSVGSFLPNGAEMNTINQLKEQLNDILNRTTQHNSLFCMQDSSAETIAVINNTLNDRTIKKSRDLLISLVQAIRSVRQHDASVDLATNQVSNTEMSR